jgi:hypothetical protein
MHSSSDQLLVVAARVLRTCAKGCRPSTRDLQCLNRHALSFQVGMLPAEIAGMTIWRIQRANETMDSAA